MKKILPALIAFILLFASFSFAAIDTTAKGAILIEESTGQIIYEKNSNEKLYPASITKVLTALIVLEECDLNETVSVSANAILSIPAGSSIAYLKKNETFTVEQLLYAMLVASGNDAANVLAEHVSGTIDDFAKLMNEKAKSLGATNSNFMNANGLHNDEHYVTAHDMALITKEAMKYDIFKTIVSTKTYTLPSSEIFKATGDNERVFKNTNLLLFEEAVAPNTKSYYYQYANGIKTGYTKKSGNTLIASSTKDGMTLICVLLNVTTTNTTNRYIEATKLFEYGFENYKLIPFTPTLTNVKIENSNQELELAFEKNEYILSTSDIAFENLVPKYTMKQGLEAPILKGASVGTVEYEINNTIYTFNLTAKNDVATKAGLGQIIWNIIKFIIKLILYIFIALIIFAIILRLYAKSLNKKKRYKGKRYKQN